jgi:hypothetical protein
MVKGIRFLHPERKGGAPVNPLMHGGYHGGKASACDGRQFSVYMVNEGHDQGDDDDQE